MSLMSINYHHHFPAVPSYYFNTENRTLKIDVNRILRFLWDGLGEKVFGVVFSDLFPTELEFYQYQIYRDEFS